MIEYLYAFLLWLAGFLPSSSLGPLLAERGKGFTGARIQGAFLILSLTIISLLRIPLHVKPVYLPQAVALGFLASLALNLGEKLFPGEKAKEKAETLEFLLRDLPLRVLLLLILAPLAEESLNRALVEGYLLIHGQFWGAIGFSALLFALPHWMAFKEAPAGEKAYITAGSFLMGLIAGYLFALSGSLLTAFAFHSSANLAGFLFSGLRKENLPLFKSSQPP
ncbi:CPBP family intramembrane glutamic endopeptidase [Thermococcus sp.]|uniref:CPBP family intramembrane glutamic endopeptidase n=1 Tax=Thermococcus sp. TaxID=35749 RepID=UPI0026184C74|nr:CPBP family intramembrane glutamic endopeptidase [Thermococcus sp.]